MLRARDPAGVAQVAAKLTAAGFACVLRGGKYDDDDGEDVGPQPDPLARVMLMLDETLAGVLAGVATKDGPKVPGRHPRAHIGPHPTVPFAGAGRYRSFRALVAANYDHMFGGFGEGLVVTSFTAPVAGKTTPQAGTAGADTAADAGGGGGGGAPGAPVAVVRGVPTPCVVTKWKIGAEGSSNNEKLLAGILDELAADEAAALFGADTADAVTMFTQMLAVEKSKLVCGKAPEPKAAAAAYASRAVQFHRELGVNSISPAHLHVRCTPNGRTCR